MAQATDHPQVATQNNAGRVSSALAISIPISISGKDANGVEFTERTSTVLITRRGGRIATKCDLALGSEMTLHNPILEQTARVKVVWMGERGSEEEVREVGVESLESCDIWGIDFPSCDRQETARQAPQPVARKEGGLEAYRGQMQELVAQLEEFKHAVKEEMSKVLRQVQGSRQRLVELALSDLKAKVEEEIESVGEELVGLTQKRLQEKVALAVEPLTQKVRTQVQAVAEERLVRAGEGVQELLSRLVQEEQAQLSRKLQSMASEFRGELGRASSAAIASAQAEIAQARSRSADGFEARLEETADQVAESAARQLRKQSEDSLLLFNEELKTSGSGCLKRLEESLSKTEGEQQRSARSAFRKVLEQESAEALARLKCDLAQALQDVAEQAARQASALQGLRKAVEEESLQTLANLKMAATQAVEEVSSKVERQVNALRKLGGEVQVRHQALPDQIEAVPKIVAGMSERNWPERAQGKMPQGAEEILQGVSIQLGQQLKESLASFRAELKLKQEQAANGIAESFRSKIFEALSVFGPSPGRRLSSAEATSPNTPDETHSPASSGASLLPGESGGLEAL
jgi:hypothetical protein